MSSFHRLMAGSLPLFAFISALFSCSYADSKLQVGIALPLSGLAAEYGEAYRQGLEMALADSPSDRPHLAVIYEDHQYDNNLAVSAVRKLAHVDKVKLVAVWGWTPSDAIAPLSSQFEIPLLLSSINPVSRGRNTVLNLASPLQHLLRPLAEHIVKNGYKSAAFLTTPVGALEQSAPELRAMLPAGLESATQHSVPPDTNDFKTILAKMKGNPPEVVVAFLLPAQLRIFIEQARALNFQVPIVGENTFNDRLVVDLFKKVEAGPVFVDWFIASDFLKRLPPGGSHQVESAQGYFLGSTLLALATGVSSPFETGSILRFLKSMPPAKTGPAGAYAIVDAPDYGLHVVFPSVLNQISNGTIRAYGRSQ